MRFTDESYEMFFAKWVTDERCSALFLGGTIFGGSHYLTPLTRPRAVFEPAQNLSQNLLNEVVQ